MKATAAVLEEPNGKFVLKEVELDDPRADEILVAIEACGVCHTDVAAQNRLAPPMVLGHEGTGVVRAVGSGVRRVSAGDRVVISYPWCGECRECTSEHAYRCELLVPIAFGGSRLDGSKPITENGTPISSAFFQQSSFATHAITLERDVVPVDTDHPAEMLAAIPCGVQTGAGAVLNSMRVEEGDSLAVFGVGSVGMSAVMAAKLVGASPIIAIDVVDTRLQLALELGATHALDANHGSLAYQVKDVIPRGVRYALDTTGEAIVLDEAIDSLAMGGECGIVTAPNEGEKYPFNPAGIFRRTATLRGIIQGSALPNEFLPKLIAWQQEGRFPYEKLVTTYDFADINQAFEDSAAGRTIKPVLMMPS